MGGSGAVRARGSCFTNTAGIVSDETTISQPDKISANGFTLQERLTNLILLAIRACSAGAPETARMSATVWVEPGRARFRFDYALGGDI